MLNSTLRVCRCGVLEGGETMGMDLVFVYIFKGQAETTSCREEVDDRQDPPRRLDI